MNETIGNRIAKYRKSRSMTQEELAGRLGVSAQAVSKWETDASCPDIQLLPQLCKELGISTDELLTGKTDEVILLPPEQRKPMEQLMLRIYVNSADGDKVKVNLPIPLVKACLEMGVDIAGTGGAAMKDVDFDKILLLVEQGIIGKLVEVESHDGDIVEVVVE